MNILHLFSNHRYTGPAEPAVLLCQALQQQGHNLLLAVGAPPRAWKHVGIAAQQRHVSVTCEFALRKHRNPITNFSDIRGISRVIQERGIEIVHTHMFNDHIIGGRAARRTGGAAVVRTCYDFEWPHGFTARHILRRLTDGLIVPTEGAAHRIADRFAFPQDRILICDTPIDLDRFNRRAPHSDFRRRAGFTADDFVVGIAARIQRHRRFDVILNAVRLASRQVPRLRLLVIGRGTLADTLLTEPVRTLKLEAIVHHAGYLQGDDYVSALASIDAKIFLVPGTDGTCRAAREAMAMGRPVIASRRGLLPELVEDGKTGLIVDDSPEELARAIVRLSGNRPQCEAIGRAAGDRAQRSSPSLCAQAVTRFYEQLLAQCRR